MATGIADPTRAEVRTEERQEVVYLLLDGLQRTHGAARRDAVLCAVGLGRDGTSIPLAMQVVSAETEQAWRDLLVDLKARGVGDDVRLVVCDDHAALGDAVCAILPDVPIQISVAHRLLGLARKVDPEWRSACLAEARQIFAAPDRNAAVARFRTWRAQWLGRGHRAVGTLEADLACCLTFYRFPANLWSKIRTVNLVERTYRGARRTAPPAPPAPDAEPLVTDAPGEALIVTTTVTEAPHSEEGDPQGSAGAVDTRQAGVEAPAGVPAENERPGPEQSPNGLERPRRHQALTGWAMAATLAPMRSLPDDFQMLMRVPSPLPTEPAISGEAPESGPPIITPLEGLDFRADLDPSRWRRQQSFLDEGRTLMAGMVTVLAGMVTGFLVALLR